MKINANIYLGKGTRLYSDRAQVLMRIMEDTCGRHDTIGGRYSAGVHTATGWSWRSR